MEPVSVVIGLVSGAAGLVVISMQTIKFLTSVCDTYTNLIPQLRVLLSTLAAFEIAWTNIHDWIRDRQNIPNQFSVQLLDRLAIYIPSGEAILDDLRKDMDSLFPSWRSHLRLTLLSRSTKLSVRLMRHQARIRSHCEKIAWQNNALTLLVSTLHLPSVPVQSAMIELNQQRFRKDEETAWTLIQTRPSPKTSLISSTKSLLASAPLRPSSLIGSQLNRDVAKIEYKDDEGEKATTPTKRFDFEDALFTGPVYRRLILTALSFGPISPKSSAGVDCGLIRTTSAAPNDSSLDGLTIAEQMSDMSSILRQSPAFSISCRNDLEELRKAPKAERVHALRHLPVANILGRERLDPDGQVAIDAEFHNAIIAGLASEVADALDAGADINSRYHEKFDGERPISSIQLCLKKMKGDRVSTERLITLDLLLLYHETQVIIVSEEICGLIHDAITLGIVSLLNRLPIHADTLALKDQAGNSAFHAAVHAGKRGLISLKKLLAIEEDLKPNSLRDDRGRSPLHVAIEIGEDLKALYLVQLGGTTSKLIGLDYSQLSELGLVIVEACNNDPRFRTTLKVNNPLGRLLSLSIQQLRTDVVRTLFEHGATCNEDSLFKDVNYANTTSEMRLQILARKGLSEDLEQRLRAPVKEPKHVGGWRANLHDSDVYCDTSITWRAAMQTPMFRTMGPNAVL